MKYQCPTYLKKVEGEKNNSGDLKSEKAYIVWDIPGEDSTTSTSEEEESTKLCLMVNAQEASTSTNVDKQSELHEELKKLARVNGDRKQIILLQEKKI
ncbi:hypothetical protein Lal_00022792 [Lupinus albus]|nr:hypothetical protein Lal_00022792 [Lupinus albus]